LIDRLIDGLILSANRYLQGLLHLLNIILSVSVCLTLC